MACGTPEGFQRHIDYGQAPCVVCYDAELVAGANRRERAKPGRGPVNAVQWRSALAGREPAEALVQADRHLLVATLHHWGWPDGRIAAHCRMTRYTTTRIRTHLGLAANRPAHPADPRRAA